MSIYSYPQFQVVSPPDPRPIFIITEDRRVIVEGDIYDAARRFWEVLLEMAPPGWSIERKEDDPIPWPPKEEKA